MAYFWEPGATIVIRGPWHHAIWWAMPATVVQDGPDLVALYWKAGTPNKIPPFRVKPHDLLSATPPALVDSHWIWTDVLMLIPPVASHALYAMWEAGSSRFLCWYVNLQSPLQRTSVGFDAEDYMLDIVIQPGCRDWRWKDEDEFDEAVALGIYSIQQAQAIRAEGEAVIRQMQSGLSPFCDGWEQWHPPVDWPIPGFPDGWDKMED